MILFREIRKFLFEISNFITSYWLKSEPAEIYIRAKTGPKSERKFQVAAGMSPIIFQKIWSPNSSVVNIPARP